jgi:hypothetical protein
MTKLDNFSEKEDQSITCIGVRIEKLTSGVKRFLATKEKDGLDPLKLKKVLDLICTREGLQKILNIIEVMSTKEGLREIDDILARAKRVSDFKTPSKHL